MGDFIPGGKINDAGFRQTEDRLEFQYGICGILAVDSVLGDAWDSGIYGSDGVKLFLNMAYLISGASNSQVISRPGYGDSGNLFRGVDIDAFPVEIPEDFDRAVALFSKGTGAPLGQP